MKTLYMLSIIAISVNFTYGQQVEDSTRRETQQDTIKYNLPAVLVTATQAQERETPATFSNLARQQIHERYTLQDIPLLLSELPSMTSYSENGSGIGYSYVNLRGFDQRRLSIMVNGVPQNDPEDHQVYWIDMPDLPSYIQNIQVQRGAGSAFYGPPAIGGSINIVTTPATAQPRISLSTGFGFQEFGGENKTKLNDRKYSLSLSSGIVNKRYLLYGNFSRISSEGYRQHSWVGLNSYFVGAARFDENMTTRIHIYGGPIADALAYTGLPKRYNDDKTLRRVNYSYWKYDSTGTQVDPNSITRQKPQANENFAQPHYEILQEWKFSSTATLYNTLFYVQGDGYFDYDGDWVPYRDPKTRDSTAIVWFRDRVGYDSTFGISKFPTFILRGFVGNKQWGWLPRIEFEHKNGKLTLGGELRMHRSVHYGKISYASEYPSPLYNPDFHFYEYNGEKNMISGYGHELYKLDDATTLMADLQLAYNRYGIHNEKFLYNDFNVSYLFLNPRFGINTNFSDSWNGYISLAYTSREPRLRNLYAAEDGFFGAQPQFEATPAGRYDFTKLFSKPEHLFDAELGAHYIFDPVKLSANVYWMEFQDELVKSGTIDIFGASVLVNAKRTRHLGIELDGRYVLLISTTDFVELSGNATLSANRIISHSFFDSSAGISRTLDKNPIAGFPDVLGNLRLKYAREQWSASVLLKYVGSFYTDNLKDEQNKVDAYSVADIDASLRLPQFFTNTELELVGKVRNLFNKLYLASGEGSAFFPAAERNFYMGITANF